MAVTRLQRRVKRRRMKSIEASNYLKEITFTPVVSKIDINEIKKNFLNNKNNTNSQKAIIILPSLVNRENSDENKSTESVNKTTVDKKKVVSNKTTKTKKIVNDDLKKDVTVSKKTFNISNKNPKTK